MIRATPLVVGTLPDDPVGPSGESFVQHEPFRSDQLDFVFSQLERPPVLADCKVCVVTPHYPGIHHHLGVSSACYGHLGGTRVLSSRTPHARTPRPSYAHHVCVDRPTLGCEVMVLAFCVTHPTTLVDHRDGCFSIDSFFFFFAIPGTQHTHNNTSCPPLRCLFPPRPSPSRPFRVICRERAGVIIFVCGTSVDGPVPSRRR